ncbi:S-layer homology domain-containing protein [Butyricicoccus sp.]|uniref:S-layer homology domain-containing protein n=1 Tax=Butyricicoccus sp. TaxID=2049021 RepID=UPI003D7DFBC5
MKKRITAYLLAFALLCTSVPTAFAAQMEPSQTTDGKFVTQANVSGTVYQSKVYSQAEHEAQLKNATFTTVEYSRNYAQETASVSQNVAEKTTNSFTNYGDQLSNYYYTFGGKKSVYVGSAMKKLYDNVKADLKKGTDGAIFRDDGAEEQKLGVTFSTPTCKQLGVSEDAYSEMMFDFAMDMSWLVYRSIDSDCPEMFYSNGYMSMSYAVNEAGNRVTVYIYPLFRKGFETYEERVSMKQALDSKTNEIIKQASRYATAYEQLEFLNTWLCENNSYNDDAAAGDMTKYQDEVSGAPWSSVSAILSSSGKTVGPVCEGYARALQLLCSKLGINATIVVSDSGNHMWNNVQYGTHWTGVDVTWNDSGRDRMAYFCTTVNNMTGHKMDDGDFVDRLSYPNLIAFSANDTLPQYRTGVVKDKILPYYDVEDSFWGISQIRNVYDKGYMSGMTCVNFGINGNVTRAQFAQILYNIAGKPAVTYTGQFSDVSQDKWYAAAVSWAAQNGLVGGYPNGTFAPNAAIKREDIAVILFHRAGSQSAQPQDLEARFSDSEQIADYAREAVNWAVASGVINGNADGTLEPRGNATRAQSAAIITNITA